jgi:alkylated DNA repair dioxygenase AlkB
VDLDVTTTERTWLDERSWVDVARGWLPGAADVHDAVEAGVPWEQGRLWRYERWVEEPRLTAWARAGSAPHAALDDAQRALQHRYGVRFDGFSLARYRDGRDSVAFHRDRDLRWLDDTVIALVVLGARRPFLLRPRSNRYAHEAPLQGAVLDLAPGDGDLIVMGGGCQAGWEHSVPKVRDPVRSRISAQWRWTSGHGRPEVGASYRAPRTFSR